MEIAKNKCCIFSLSQSQSFCLVATKFVATTLFYFIFHYNKVYFSFLYFFLAATTFYTYSSPFAIAAIMSFFQRLFYFSCFFQFFPFSFCFLEKKRGNRQRHYFTFDPTYMHRNVQTYKKFSFHILFYFMLTIWLVGC